MSDAYNNTFCPCCGQRLRAGPPSPRKKPGPKLGTTKVNIERMEALILGGATYSEIGPMLGCSRERIRQLAKQKGIVSYLSHSAALQRKKAIRAKAKKGIDPGSQVTRQMLNKAGVSSIALRRHKFDAQNAGAYVAIRSGASINSQARDRNHYNALYAACRRLGIVSTDPRGGGIAAYERKKRVSLYLGEARP